LLIGEVFREKEIFKSHEMDPDPHLNLLYGSGSALRFWLDPDSHKTNATATLVLSTVYSSLFL
jgi:hypothetical protein